MDEAVAASLIVHSQCLPLVVSKVEFGKVPFNVLRTYMVVHTVNSAFKDRKISLRAGAFFGDGRCQVKARELTSGAKAT
jgi:hypothetical protein